MKKLIIFLFLLVALPRGLWADATKTVGPSGSGADYTRLKLAFDAINSGTIKGVIVLQIIGTTTETASAVLRESGFNGNSSYTSVTIYPTVSGKIISGNIAGALIDFNGADNVTFDGRVSQSGSANLIVSNTSTSSSATTIRFQNDATSDIIKYCIIKGSATNTAGGVIHFSTTTGTTGNDNNTIDHNNLTYAGSTRPVNAIYSLGTDGKENSGCIISDNNFYDFLKNGTASNGILLSSFTTTWTISGNSFYETASFAPGDDVAFNVINIDNTSGTGFAITGNYIGGSSATCGGTAWTKTNEFDNALTAISMNVGTGTVSSIQNNTIKNFDWSNSAISSWTGILIAGGDVNIGTSSANTIGSGTGTGSITITNAQPGSLSFGINITGTGIVDCRNNIIGSITTANDAANANDFYCIKKDPVPGTTTIRNNTIGSTTTANSINASSESTDDVQSVFGILNAGSGTITISDNVIANLTNSLSSTNPSNQGLIIGIGSDGGAITVSNNTIRDLTIANANDASNQTGSVCGISLTGVDAIKTVAGNTIYNLSNTYASFAGQVVGLYFSSNTGSNIVSENFIHSLSVTGVSSTTASLYGIKINSGATTYSNNIISLGGNTKSNIYGIYESGASGNNNNLYFNTLYVGGDGDGGTNNSYALYSAVTTNTRNFRNNIFFNARSTTSGSDLHYAAYIASAGGSITCDFNDYRASGTYGATLGYYGGNKTVLPIVTGQDASSFAINPNLSSPGGTSAGNYLPSAASLVAVTGTGITTDYDGGAARSGTYPSMGAFEYTVAPGAWTWTGSSTTNWNTAANWNYNTVPPASGNAIIADVTNDPIVNEAATSPAECQDLTINTGAILTIAAGKDLKVNGTLTNNAGNSGLVIKSDANGNDGKLINNSSSVSATVELFFSGGLNGSSRIYHYIVPAVQSMTIGVNSPYPTVAEAKNNLGLSNNFKGDLLSYSESVAGANRDNGWQFFDGWNGTTGFSSLLSTMGYNIHSDADDKITFTGALNGAAHSFGPLSFTNLGWNLVGNPYPCNYDLTGISLLTGSSDGVDNTVYFNNNGGYAFWNVDLNTGSSGFSNVVSPMQGFFVHATSTGKTLSLPTGYKTTSTAAPSRSKGYSIVKKLKLVLNNGVVPDETIICLVDKASPGFDSDFDAYKLFGTGSSTPYIYTELNSVKYALNSIMDPGTSTAVIPMTVVLKSPGTYKIDITEFDNLDGIDVALKHGSEITTLSKGSSYSFSSPAGTYKDFQIIIGKSVTGVEDIVQAKIKAWYSNDYLIISCPKGVSSNNGRLVIYDMQGKPVFEKNPINLMPGQNFQIPLNLPKGVYVTNILVNNQPFVSKIVVF